MASVHAHAHGDALKMDKKRQVGHEPALGALAAQLRMSVVSKKRFCASEVVDAWRANVVLELILHMHVCCFSGLPDMGYAMSV